MLWSSTWVIVITIVNFFIFAVNFIINNNGDIIFVIFFFISLYLSVSNDECMALVTVMKRTKPGYKQVNKEAKQKT